MFILTFILNFAFAQESCKQIETVQIQEKKEDVNTPTPEQLKDAVILVKTKDGKVQEMKASDFKVVPRKQQFKVKERIIVQKMECQPKTIVVEKIKREKNLVMLGARKDHTGLTTDVSGSTASVYSKKGLVFDLGYMRKNILDTPLGVGASIDTNGTLRGMLGLEF